MTFERFQQTKAQCTDLGAHLKDCMWEDCEHPAVGLIYLDTLYIEGVGPNWPEETKAQGNWLLTLGREQYVTDDLEDLERKLYDWAVSEGYTS